jgi:tripartite-type tricarboxylate transporter receptor subunit TctC
MKLPRRKFLHLAAGAAALACTAMLFSSDGTSQDQEMKIVVTFPRGSGGDLMTRIAAEHISRKHGVSVTFENSAAAAGTAAVARAAPDGNTLLMINNNFVVDSNLRKLTPDPLVDFEPVCNLASAQNLFVVDAAAPYRTLSDLITAARAKPGEVTMTAVPGTTQHLGLEMLRIAAKVNMTFVPATGGSINIVLGGNAPLAMLLDGRAVLALQNYQNPLEHLKSGRLRALASASRKRLEALPDLLTVDELGYKGYDLDLWDGIFAPAKTSKGKIALLISWFSEALQEPTVRSKIMAEALIPVGACGGEFVSFIRKQQEAYGRIVNEANIKVQ